MLKQREIAINEGTRIWPLTNTIIYSKQSLFCQSKLKKGGSQLTNFNIVYSIIV